MGVTQRVQLQIGQWKGKEYLKVIHLDDYDFVLNLNFLDRIDALLILFFDYICILVLENNNALCTIICCADESRHTHIQVIK